MKKDFFVIDQNYLRKEDLDQRLQQETEMGFVLTDTTLIEMLKSPSWEYISERSLKIIASQAKRIWVSNAVSDLLRLEIKSKRPISPDDIISPILTKRLRLYLQEFANQGQIGARHGYMANHITQAQMDLAHRQLNHSRNLNMLRNAYEAMKKYLGEEKIRAMKNNEFGDEKLSQIILSSALLAITDPLRENGFNEDEIEQFSRFDSFMLRQIIAFFLLCHHWIIMGGIECLNPEKATNDLMDINYILIASYGKGILSCEKKVNDLHMKLQQVLERIITSN